MGKFKEIKVNVAELHTNDGQIEGVPANPRFTKDDKFKRLCKSLQEDPEMLEMRKVVAYDNHGELVVVMGNMRLRAMRELKEEETEAIILPTDTPAEKLKRYIIKDNASFGEWDWDMLANEWDEADLVDWGVDVWQPMDAEEDEKGMKDGENANEDGIDASKVETIVKSGDIWQLGKHRMMCGDSTKSEMVAKLMNGEKADVCFTSPPYNMKWDTNIQAYSKLKKCIPGSYNKGQTYKEYDDAHQSDAEYQNLLTK